ncbi:MAG: EAL domain-containing protein, partial [Treponema sp.]|nr:EAL domain-containing protein [Treponema sp.]
DLGMEVVAEGVEDYGEYDLVVYLGCNYIQGFMFSNPLTPEEYIKFIAKI